MAFAVEVVAESAAVGELEGAADGTTDGTANGAPSTWHVAPRPAPLHHTHSLCHGSRPTTGDDAAALPQLAYF